MTLDEKIKEILGIKRLPNMPWEARIDKLTAYGWLWENRISLVAKKTKGGCLEWDFSKNTNGYPEIRYNPSDSKSVIIRLHRLVWCFFRQETLTEFECICHKCDNPACFNINHLFKGTQRDNVKDMMQKGRGRGQFKKGVFNGKRKKDKRQPNGESDSGFVFSVHPI